MALPSQSHPAPGTGRDLFRIPLTPARRWRRSLPRIAAGWLTLACLAAFGPVGIAVAEDSAPELPIIFNRDIRPILSENCFFCHGPDAGHREADLRLDVRDEAVAAAIIPGDASASPLIDRILSDDPDLVMPPPTTGRALTDEQRQLLRRWVDSGAEYQSHWSLVPPMRSQPPAVDEPGWQPHPVDRFLLAAMQARGLTPQPEADRETLIRRLAFDLTGLPPTLEQIDAFLRDEQPLAYERLVDSLLASPRFGERMAADWLDVARYSDSYGMQVDRDRRVWPYRDWVIQAFNANLPYDRFITEQLAGDLLDNPTDSQILATAFNRLHPQECEGGSVPEEFRIEYVADRTQTVATAFLGLTLECSRCHDHKYDPLSQAEYYQLTSFFDNVDEAGLYSYFTESVPTPTLLLPTSEQAQRIAELDRAVAELEAKADAIRGSRQAAFTEWSRGEPSARVAYPPAGAIKHLDFESETPPAGTTSVPGVAGRAVRIGGDDAVNVGVGNFNRWDPFTVSLWMQVSDLKERAVVFHRSRAWTDAASRGYELLIDAGHLQASLIHFWPGNAISVRTVRPLTLGQWQQVAVTWDGSSRAAGLAIYVNGERAETEIVRDHLSKNITGGGGDEIAIGARFRDRGLSGGEVDEFFVWDRQLSDRELAALFARQDVPTSPAPETAAEQPGGIEPVYQHYLLTQDAEYGQTLLQLRAAREASASFVEPIPEMMVMREMQPRRQTHILRRGAYDAKGDPVEPATPAALLPWDPSWPNNRLGFAKWLTDPRHPLTARVAVNRLWQGILGRGLVATPEDFGSQGSPPTHPELLDWLAVEFVDGGWDVKGLIRLLVTSAAYRQASAELDPRDPENLFLSRSPRYRWPAEMLRDNALAIAGLLAEEIGGPPAKPYEVESSFKPVGRDKGPGLHRRSLYTYWNRTGPAPALTTLDAGLRDVCRMKREVTATPLQSLVVLNSPQFVEAARGMAERLHHRHGEDLPGLLHDLFRVAVGRAPTAEEIEALTQLHEKQRARFQANPEQAARWLTVGDVPPDAKLPVPALAATASVANMLLNYDGCVSKR